MSVDLVCDACGELYGYDEGHKCDPRDVAEQMRAEMDRRAETANEGSPELQAVYGELVASIEALELNGLSARVLKLAPRLGRADFNMLVMACLAGEWFRQVDRAEPSREIIRRLFECAESVADE